MIKVDLHIHTQFSCDSTTTMDEYCKRAIMDDVRILCFTDHVDYNPKDIGYKFYKPNEFFKEFNRVKYKYKGELEVLSGIEFSEPHLYKKEFDELKKLPYDFILGSMHFWYKDMFPSTLIENGISKEICFDYYYKETLKSVNAGGYDSLAHFGFPIRYYKEAIYPTEIITEVLSVLIKEDIALEINTSSLRKELSEPMPCSDILKLYRDLGGKYITFGADSHSPNELASDFIYVNKKASELSLIPVYFKQRKMLEI